MAALTAADVAHVHADEIDEPVLDQRQVLRLIDEELAHGDGGGGLLPDQAEVLQLLRRQRIFQEEHPV